jgi:hypothetical protein
MDVVDRKFRYLFRGREDIWGAVHGQSIQRKLDDADWERHLRGDGSIGIYPLVKANGVAKVAWGCTDIDDGYEQSQPLARNVQRALRALGVTSWVEITKGKGFHVWVFVEGWVEAETMRNCLLFAHQVAGVAPTEVNPKSVNGGKGGNGNYVNLPYAAKWAVDNRRVALASDGAPWSLADFVDMAHGTLNQPDAIAAAAARYKPPPPPPRINIAAYGGGDLSALVGRLPGLAYKIFQEGNLEGRDRSGTLMRFAYLMAESKQLEPGEALALLADADSRWGKFYEREDGLEQMERIVTNAFGKVAAAG